MSWSARWRKACGIVSPSALTVFKLMTNSNLVGCSTGKSPGLAPFKIFATCPAARRITSAVRHEGTPQDLRVGPHEHREPPLCRESGDLTSVRHEKRARHQDNAAGPLASHRCER